MKLTITDVLRSTGESCYISNDDYETLIWNSDELKPTKEWCEEKLLELQALEDAQEYAINRQKEYPTLEDQADMQYWDAVNGTTTWKDAIAKVKADNPKP